MASVFHKLINREFGKEKYHFYFSSVKENLATRSLHNKEVYDDIYMELISKDVDDVADMQERLNETMLRALRINKTFIGVVLAYCIGVFTLLALEIGSLISLLAIFLMTIFFTIKSYEFYENRNCYIDAQIILMYKAAIDKILAVVESE